MLFSFATSPWHLSTQSHHCLGLAKSSSCFCPIVIWVDWVKTRAQTGLFLYAAGEVHGKWWILPALPFPVAQFLCTEKAHCFLQWSVGGLQEAYKQGINVTVLPCWMLHCLIMVGQQKGTRFGAVPTLLWGRALDVWLAHCNIEKVPSLSSRSLNEVLWLCYLCLQICMWKCLPFHSKVFWWPCLIFTISIKLIALERFGLWGEGIL